MAATTSLLTGLVPISFTHSTRGQLFVPLSAFQLSGSAVALTPDWASAITGADQVVLRTLAQGKLAAG